MPAATEYSTASVNSRDLRQAAEAERRARQRSISAAQQYYDGDQWRPLLPADGIDHNVIVNLCRQVVDRLVAFLFPEMPGLELREGRTTSDERILAAAWDAAGGVRKLATLAMSGAISGHVFARVMDDIRGPRIVNLDPRNVLVFWAADDVERVLWYEIEYKARGVKRRQDIINEGTQWRIVNWEFRREWARSGEDVIWNSPLSPIVDWQHGPALYRYYGRGELVHRELNDRINSVASDMAKILHHHASPRTIATGVGEVRQAETGPDQMFVIKNPSAKVYNLEMQSDLAAGMNFIQLMERTFFGESRVVRLSGDIRDMQRVTNLGIRALYIDQLAKNEDLRRRYEWGIQEITMRIQFLLGLDIQRPAVHWPDPLPQDPLQTVELVERERALGLLSRETQAAMLGIDWTLEQERMLADDDLELLSMEMLGRQPGFGVSGTLLRNNPAPGNGAR